MGVSTLSKIAKKLTKRPIHLAPILVLPQLSFNSCHVFVFSSGHLRQPCVLVGIIRQTKVQALEEVRLVKLPFIQRVYHNDYNESHLRCVTINKVYIHISHLVHTGEDCFSPVLISRVYILKKNHYYFLQKNFKVIYLL